MDKKIVVGLSPTTNFSSKFAFANYLTESTTAESTEAESTAESTATESESAVLACSVLLPQDAKEIAAIATNIKTNFFIFLCFLNL